ncbi:DUF4160 domain-containing protein [Sphingomonas sp. BIUV-7]|uniref:DUF4160 domain-containing protein n=1 Tax=Sphingomonas natans TaxID=3063330 RepID=A0ABT8YEA6_9SPHN|nr:DUF4160 domain-containing protein [Sphingomonas sp. BIUV-7]MDO6416688.1 DUF4160 domain-containing protein [Sphingomonas sp. BIUV-7]
MITSPHVHVFGDGECKIELETLKVVRTVDANKAESRRALRIVRNSRDILMRRWTELHG